MVLQPGFGRIEEHRRHTVVIDGLKKSDAPVGCFMPPLYLGLTKAAIRPAHRPSASWTSQRLRYPAFLEQPVLFGVEDLVDVLLEVGNPNRIVSIDASGHVVKGGAGFGIVDLDKSHAEGIQGGAKCATFEQL